MTWWRPKAREKALEAVPGWHERDLPWRAAEFCVLDLEATGLDLRRDEIVSYGAVLVRDGRVVVGSSVYGLVRPERRPSPESVAVHALTPDELDVAPGLDACVDRLTELLRGRALVAHAAWVESAFLDRAFRPRGVRLDGPVVDTAALAREAGQAPGGAAGEPQLEALAERLGLPPHPPHHALADALMTAEVFLVLATTLERGLERDRPLRVGDLAAVSRRRALHAARG